MTNMINLMYVSEFAGTLLLIYLGSSGVANVVLKKTKGSDMNSLAIHLGWAAAVLIPALIFGNYSGAHFNPALTVALAVAGLFEWKYVTGYILCQLTGAFFGACLVYLHYKDHFNETEDGDVKLGVFSTIPAIRNIPMNLLSEILTTCVLVFTVLGIDNAELGAVNPFAVAGIIFMLGVCLGGTTGYAINPARDLGPRIAHFFLPIQNKRDSDWSYSWIPFVGPFIGAITGALLYKLIFIL